MSEASDNYAKMAEDGAAGGVDAVGALVGGDRKIGLFAVIALASAVELARAATLCDQSYDCGSYLAYAVAVGGVSLVVSVLCVLASKGGKLTGQVELVAGGLLFAWWVPAVLVLTFKSPFTATGNGYFACWVAFFVSTWLLSELWPTFRNMNNQMQAKTKGPVGFLLVASIFELIAASFACSSYCRGEVAYAVAVGAISILVCVIMMAGVVPGQYIRWVNGFMLVWWLAAAGILTFGDTFTITGNGYFATWAAVAAAAMLWGQQG